MLLAIRDGETSSFTTEGIADLCLDRLDDREAALLLDGRSTPVAMESRARVLALAQGNPLAILELPDLVAVEPELGTREPTLPSGSLISRAFGRRIEGLPDDTTFRTDARSRQRRQRPSDNPPCLHHRRASSRTR